MRVMSLLPFFMVVNIVCLFGFNDHPISTTKAVAMTTSVVAFSMDAMFGRTNTLRRRMRATSSASFCLSHIHKRAKESQMFTSRLKMSKTSDDEDGDGGKNDPSLSSSGGVGDEKGAEPQQQSSSMYQRGAISGVSVSPKGFHVMLDTSQGIIPLPVTPADGQDSYAATSPESLTIIQLLSGVDMAGAILPPETLAKMVVLYAELQPFSLLLAGDDDGSDGRAGSGNDSAVEIVLNFIKKSLPDGVSSYSEAHPWQQSRIRLPQVTLDQLTLSYDANEDKWVCGLECAIKESNVPSSSTNPSEKGGVSWSDIDAKRNGPQLLSIPSSADIVRPVSYNYDADTSELFTCLALSLRYKAPVVITNARQAFEAKKVLSPDDMDETFPQRTTVANLQSTSSRVTENIERGFEIHKLTGALQIAMKMGDQGAVDKIRAKLDEYDSMDSLPTTLSSASSSSSPSPPQSPPSSSTNSTDMGIDIDEGTLDDDLDQNILQ